jgi:hypothetical protein
MKNLQVLLCILICSRFVHVSVQHWTQPKFQINQCSILMIHGSLILWIHLSCAVVSRLNLYLYVLTADIYLFFAFISPEYVADLSTQLMCWELLRRYVHIAFSLYMHNFLELNFI